MSGANGGDSAATPRVLICEKIAPAGVELLESQFDVDLGLDWDRDKLEAEVAAYDALVVRSATKVDSALIGLASRLQVVGRAGTGVDNVDVDAATKRGIIVCNAAGSNALSAAEHAVALLLAQARNVAQAHTSLVDGRWERSKFGGIEVTGKTVGVVGFGRIGQLVAERARGLGMRVLGYDPFVADGRFAELGVDRVAELPELYGQCDFVSLHVASTPETRGMIDAEALGQMKPGARIINAARGDLVDENALAEAIESGHIGGAGIDVFREEPTTESVLFGLPGVVVTPHLGASTSEAQDRAGTAVAEQVAAALSGGVVSLAVNAPAVAPEQLAVLGPFLPLARQIGALVAALAEGQLGVLEISYEGELARLDTRLLTAGCLAGLLRDYVTSPVNLVNAGSLATERGIEWAETSRKQARDYTNRLSVRMGDVSLSGTTVGTTSRPRLVSAFEQDIDIELGPYMGIFRYQDIPGQIGRVGTILGEANVNIASAAVSRGSVGGGAIMAVTVDSEVPGDQADRIAALDGFEAAWFVSLGA